MCARIDSLGSRWFGDSMVVEQRRSRVLVRRWSLSGDAAFWALPIGGVVAYAVAFVATLPALLVAVYASADVAIAPYLSQAWLRAPAGSVMLMGHAPFYMGYWILWLLHGFGAYRGSWELAPWVLSTVASLLVGRAVGRAIDRTAGFLVSAVLICAGSFLLQLQFAWSIHALAYVNIMLLGVFVVWLSSDPARAHPICVGAVALPLTLMTAAGIATDKLVLAAGVVPFVVTGGLVMWRAERDLAARTARVVLAVVGGSVVGSLLIHAAMQREGIGATPFPLAVAPLTEVPFHLKLLAQGVVSLLNGDIGQPDASPAGLLGFVCATAAAYLLILAAIEIAQCLRRVAPQVHGASLSRDARRVQAAYWGISSGVLIAAYLFTTVGIDINTRRYLVTVAYAVAILGISRGASLTRTWRISTAGAATVLILAGVIGLSQHDLAKTEPTAPTAAMAQAVRRLADRDHAAVVYAGYWDAYPLGWLASDSNAIYPVTACGNGLCAWIELQGAGTGINTWYSPRHHVRSLLILDRKLNAIDGLPSLPPRSLGPAAARSRLDHGRLHAYLYNYDIASRFGG